MGQRRLDFGNGPDVIAGKIAMGIDPGGNGKDVGIKDLLKIVEEIKDQ